MMSKLSLIVIVLLLQSCINNDIPYPTVNLFITDVEADGMIGRAAIVNDERTVTLTLADTVNLKKVFISKLTTTEGANSTLSSGEYINLTKTQWITLSLYQEYQWKLIANQTIERIYKIDNQVGVSTYDLKNYIGYANMVVNDIFNPEKATPKLSELKLGPTGSTINNIETTNPDVVWTWMNSYWTTKVKVNFRHFEEPQEWSLYIFPTASTVSTTSVDAWVNVAWLHGEGLEDNVNGFEIREASSQEWQIVNPSSITSSGSKFTARVNNLKAETNYYCRAYSGEDYGEELSFTTGKPVALPNGYFEEWHKAGKVWNPWAENGTPIWDSGNDGVTTLGDSNTQPSSDIRPGAAIGSQSARLESKFVGIGTIGKFAAGNLFIGEFKKVDGTNGILDFGKPFTARPTKLKGYYKYTTAPINYASAQYEAIKGQPDTCAIYMALGDWSEPVEIRTRPSNAKYFDRNDPRIIAYAEFNSGNSITDYTEFELELDYRSTNRVPTYLIVVCSASKYGDFFTGGSGSILYVDDFSLEYDY